MRFDKIVVEGPNNVGKSSIIHLLQNYLGWEVEHVTGTCPNDYKFYDDLLSCSEPLIFDRLHLGEMVYPEIFNRKQNLSEIEFEDLCYKHCEHTLIVIIDADFDFIIKSNARKNEHFNYCEVWQEKQKFYELSQFCRSVPNALRFKNHFGESDKIYIYKKILEAIGFDNVQ